MKTVIDATKALQGLREAVAERGQDHVYPGTVIGCLYWHSDEKSPGCLVGLALTKLGVPNDVIEKLDYASGGDAGISATFMHQPEHADIFGDFEVTEGASSVFGHAQRRQDNGDPWGDALEAAEAKALDVSA